MANPTHEAVVRSFYAARAAGDDAALRDLLAEDIAWHEPGNEDYSGDTHGREQIMALLAKLTEATGGTFRLEPTAVIESKEHAAAVIEWSAERAGVQATGREIGVFRIEDGRIAEAWFHPEFDNPEAASTVFALD